MNNKVSMMVAYEKVIKTIDSCISYHHYFPTVYLIRNWRKNYLNESPNWLNDRWLLYKLEDRLSNHFKKLNK